MTQDFPPTEGPYLWEDFDYRTSEISSQARVTIEKTGEKDVIVHFREVVFDSQNRPVDDETWKIVEPKKNDEVKELTFKGKFIEYYPPEKVIRILLENGKEIFINLEKKRFSYSMNHKTQFLEYCDLKWYLPKMSAERVLMLGDLAQKLVQIIEPTFYVDLKSFVPFKWVQGKTQPGGRRRDKTVQCLNEEGVGFEITYRESKNAILGETEFKFSGIKFKAVGLLSSMFEHEETNPVPEFNLILSEVARLGVEGNFPARHHAAIMEQLTNNGFEPINEFQKGE